MLKVDLTDCGITKLDKLKYFEVLQTLVIDHNNLASISHCPNISTLKTLWCNNNQILNLSEFLDVVAKKFPNLQHLSIMRNPCTPSLADLLIQEEIEKEASDKEISENNIENNDINTKMLVSDTAATTALSNSTEEIEIDDKKDIKIETDFEINTGDFEEECNSPISCISNMTNTPKQKQKLSPYEVIHLYRIAVLSKLPQLRELDGIDVTFEEFNESQLRGAGDWLIQDLNDEDEDWRWPEGYTPKSEWRTNSFEVGMIRKIQNELDKSGYNYRENATKTYWDVNKKTIARYLEASFWKDHLNGVPVSKAIIETIKWRLNNKSGRIPINDRNILVKGLSSGQMFICGESLSGRPLMYLMFGKDKLLDSRLNATCLLYTFERAIQSMSSDQTEFVMIMDMAGFGYKNVPSMTIMSEMTDILAKHVPRRLGQVYVVNVSYIVTWVYDMLSISLSDVTKSKFRFISGGKIEMLKVMREQIDENVLPEQYGGMGKLEFDVNTYLESDPYLSGNAEKKIYS